ncbi:MULTISPECIES: DcrB-related protein [Actinosynnema]|uniref:DcrB-related protein n=1 Tax=Actinosynnema TaxID=40566 RepID=UPI0020A52ACD|nr:DcrB-related protein [Actinosynnema pretiosum]MCP2092259.1 hypothetical protein [Actinosynnema pretiosum]
MRYAGIPSLLLPVPQGWEDRSQLILAVAGEGFRRNLLVVVEDLSGRSEKDFVEGHLETLAATFAHLSVRLEEPVKLGAHEGQLLDYDFTSDGLRYRQRQFLVFRGERAYCFTYSDTSDRFEEHVQAMEQLVGGMRFVDEGRPADAFEV